MRIQFRAFVFGLTGLLLVGGDIGDLQGKSRQKKKNPQTIVIIHYDDDFAEKPPWAGGPGGGEEDPPASDGISYSFIGTTWGTTSPNLTFEFDPSGFPAGTYLEIWDSFMAWEDVTEGKLLSSLNEQVGVPVIFGDNVNTYTMRNLGGGGVLAATYITWDDKNGDGIIDSGEPFTEMDVVHNYTVSWAIAEDNPKGRWWDIRNVATHEIGHVYGLSHSGNDDPEDAEQTMYASAPAKETKKRSLAAGDITGIQILYGAPPPLPEP